MGSSNLATGTPVLFINGSSSVSLFGRTTAERLRRQFDRAGVSSVATPVGHDGPVIVVRADAVLDQPLIPVLVNTPGLMLMGEDNAALAACVQANDVAAVCELLASGKAGLGLDARKPADLDVKFWKALRKRETPYAFTVNETSKAATEWRMFMGTYKGATDLITKHLWPVPAFHATRWLAPRGVTPNMVTMVAAILTVLAFWLFWRGDFAAGLVAAWAMTFLDTVDGKLARVTLTSSKWGDAFDHGIDLVHPPFWYVAWALGLGASGLALSPATFWWVITAILGGYVVQRVMEGIAIAWLGLEIHIWREVDTLFRQVTARRNPNLILLTLSVLIGQPDWGLIAVAAWTVICLILHGLQLAQAASARRQGPLTSWMTVG